MRLTWWGHSTCAIELAGVRVLTDPLLVDRLAHLARQPEATAPTRDSYAADVVLVSHLHPDHLHVPSLARVSASARLVVPRGGGVLLRGARFAGRVDEVGPGDTVTVGDLTVTAVPAHHDGHRYPRSRLVGPALGFVARGADHAVWFAGDTGLFEDMAAIGPVDTAIVPVGGWGPTLGPHHLDPAQAAEAVTRVGASHALPVHYGTFWPRGLRRMAPRQFEAKCREPGRRFAAALAARGAAQAHVVVAGGSVDLL